MLCTLTLCGHELYSRTTYSQFIGDVIMEFVNEFINMPAGITDPIVAEILKRKFMYQRKTLSEDLLDNFSWVIAVYTPVRKQWVKRRKNCFENMCMETHKRLDEKRLNIVLVPSYYPRNETALLTWNLQCSWKSYQTCVVMIKNSRYIDETRLRYLFGRWGFVWYMFRHTALLNNDLSNYIASIIVDIFWLY